MSLPPDYCPTDQANLPPGVIPDRAVADGIMAAFDANGGQPLSQAQMLAITGPAPAYPTSLPRFPDSNPFPAGELL